jgi:hypothetical protein
MRPDLNFKEKPGAMVAHRGPGIVSTLARIFNMRTIQRHHLEIHLPLFDWADAQRTKSFPLGVRVLARRRNLPPWRAIAISEIAGFGGLSNDL